MKKKKFKKSTLIYVGLLILVMVFQGLGLFQAQEYDAEDSRYQKGGWINPNIFVIGIDEDTLNSYGKWETWSRDKMADMINLLTEDPETAPAVIAIDVGYFGETGSDADQKLVDAVKHAGNVVLTETATFGSIAGEGNQVVVYERPFDALLQACHSSGHANVTLDPDGVARHATGRLKYGEEYLPSFDYEIYKAYLEKTGQGISEGKRWTFGNDPGKFYISYSGEPRNYFGSVGAASSFKAVLDGDYPVRAFKNSIVLIGAYASGLQDSYYTSIDKETQMNGVEIHANIVAQLLAGTYKTEFDMTKQLIITAIMGILAILILTFFEMKLAILAEIVLAVLYLLATRMMYTKSDTLLPIIYPIIAVALITIVYVGVSYFTERAEKKRIISNYGKYLSPEIAKSIADIGEESLQLGGTKKDIAVLFVDIRSFTTLSESLPPERVVEMLNSYLKITTSSIFDNEGTVDKFIGDATMGVFNAPLDLDDYTFKAVCAGLEMAERGKKIDAELPEDLRGRVGFGVGINCGDAVVGNIGTDFRMEYTAIGDTVNTASRLEGQAKAGNVVISEAVYERVKDRIRCEDMGKVPLKGKAEPLQIYRAVELIK